MTNLSVSIRPWMVDAAIKEVRDGFKSGLIGREEFNMGFYETMDTCGTTRCIGGWAADLLGLSGKLGYELQEIQPRAKELFAPTGGILSKLDWYTINKKQAIHAIDNYLAGKPHPWNDIELTKTQRKQLEQEA